MRGRKQPVYRFSGAPSWDPSALRDALSNARSVQLSRGGFLIFATDRHADVLDDTTAKYVSVVRGEDGPLIDEPGAVGDLVEALSVTEVTDILCMCTGDVAAEFFDDDGKLLAVVRLDFPNRIEWAHWPGQAYVTDPNRLRRWFAAHYDIAM
ncbi:hypothetical protein AB0H36_47685 [Kribbella sp. NPDC050820]|uniref:hypothetical protein n=1 Tax=Kribbella sp. NPDC050820 TaxID=3155408 RepID=UPI0033D9704B